MSPATPSAKATAAPRRRRWLRLLLILLAVGVFTAYFGFRTFVFDPLEDDYAGDLAGLIPRDVDFFAGRRDLRSEFARFPPADGADIVPALEAGPALLATPGVASWLQSSSFEAWTKSSGLDAGLVALNQALAQLPIAVDPLAACGGQAVAVAGYLRSGSLAQADVCVYARLNGFGKLALAALDYPGLLKLDQQGLQVERQDGHLALSGRGLARPLFLQRVRDVLVLGTDAKLVDRASELERIGGQDSFGQSARYADHVVAHRSAQARELELHFDARAWLDKSGQGKLVWPNTASQDWMPAFLGRLFQLGLIKEAQGVLDLDQGVALSAHADLSSELMTPAMRRLYRTKSFEKASMLEAARYVPSDAVAMLYVHADVGDLLRAALESWEPAGRSNLNDVVRNVWGFPDANKLIDELDAALSNRLLLFARPLDYRDEGLEGPPHDSKATYAWTLLTWMENSGKVNALHKKAEDNPGQLGVRGREASHSGVWSNRVQGYPVVEFWNSLVPGTGHISTLRGAENLFAISNHHQALGQVLSARFEDAATRRTQPLAEDPNFASLIELGQPYANALLYLNPRIAAPTLQKMVAGEAPAAIAAKIDWKKERPRIEQDVARRDFAGAAPAEGSAERARFDELVQVELDKFRDDFVAKGLGDSLGSFQRALALAQVARAVLVELALDEKHIELSARAIVDLGSPAQ